MSDGFCSLLLRHAKTTRRLDMHRADLFELPISVYAPADICILATDFADSVWPRIADVLQHLKPGARLMTYRDLVPHVWPSIAACPFERIARNARFATSWSAAYPFLLWRKKETHQVSTLPLS